MVLGYMQCLGVLHVWILIGQGPTVISVGAEVAPSYHLFSLSRLAIAKYCLKEQLNPQQPTNQLLRPITLPYA